MILFFLFSMLLVSIFGYFDKRLTEYVGVVYVIVCARLASDRLTENSAELLILASYFAIYLVLLTGYMLAFKPKKCQFYRRRVGYYLWSALPIYHLFFAIHFYPYDVLPKDYLLHVAVMLGFALLFYPIVSAGIWLVRQYGKRPLL